LTAHLQEWQAHVILIQYHEAFLSPHAFQQMLFSILELGLKIIVIIHKFVGCDINVFSNLQNKGVQFLSHSRREIQSAAEVGLDIRFMPHGIMVPSVIAVKTVKGRDFKVNPPVITSTGFLRSHKGLLKLIYAVSLMQRRYPGTKLILQCALYRSQDSEETLIRCRNTIRECNLDQLVEMNIEFLPIDAVHNALRRADIAVLPYEMSDEGGSGSASTCLASGLPVVVSKAMIFDELCEVTYQLEDTSPETIAESLLKIFDEPTIYEDLIKKTHEYIRTVSYENISRRIVELFEEKILLNEVHTGDFHMSNASDEYYVFQNAECIL
jgi:glycosyltransferase involved in cell wall biosynthesis